MEDLKLEHATPDCTGFWRQRETDDHRYWWCDACGAVSCCCCTPMTTAALQENSMGIRLQLLESDGRGLLQARVVRKRW